MIKIRAEIDRINPEHVSLENWHEACAEIDRQKAIIESLVYISVSTGNISRGAACKYLGIDRADLDDWLAKREGEAMEVGNDHS